LFMRKQKDESEPSYAYKRYMLIKKKTCTVDMLNILITT